MVKEVDGEKVRLGRVWLDRSDVMSWNEAWSFFREQIQLDPTNVRFRLSRGTMWEISGGLEEAYVDYSTAIRQIPIPLKDTSGVE